MKLLIYYENIITNNLQQINFVRLLICCIINSIPELYIQEIFNFNYPAMEVNNAKMRIYQMFMHFLKNREKNKN